MYDKHFNIKNYPDDIYNAVGQIIEAAQEWEQEFKQLALMLDIKVKKVGKSSLNKLNDALKKNDLIDEKDFKKLKAVIDVRNYINHDFFLSDFQKQHESYEQKLKELEKRLNTALFLIFEATDFIDNKIEGLQGGGSPRPTIFD